MHDTKEELDRHVIEWPIIDFFFHPPLTSHRQTVSLNFEQFVIDCHYFMDLMIKDKSLSSTHAFIHSFIHSDFHSFTAAIIHSFIHSFMRALIHRGLHSSGLSFTEACIHSGFLS
jgi:hypothetical protein